MSTLTDKLRAVFHSRHARISTSPVPVKMTEEYNDFAGVDSIYTVSLTWQCHVKVDELTGGGAERAKEEVVAHFARTLYGDIHPLMSDMAYVIGTECDSRVRGTLLEHLNKIAEAMK